MRKRDTVKHMEVRVKVVAGAKREGVTALSDGRLEIRVKPEAKAGAANERVVELAAAHFRVARSRVRILRGAAQPSKTLSIR